jgi:hypothetical protein
MEGFWKGGGGGEVRWSVGSLCGEPVWGACVGSLCGEPVRRVCGQASPSRSILLDLIKPHRLPVICLLFRLK